MKLLYRVEQVGGDGVVGGVSGQPDVGYTFH